MKPGSKFPDDLLAAVVQPPGWVASPPWGSGRLAQLGRLGWLCALALLLVACTHQEEGPCQDPDGDDKRNLAKKVNLDRDATDSVNATGCDKVDWKFIQVEQEGQLTVKIALDNPEVTGAAEITDSLGQRITRIGFNGIDRLYEKELQVGADSRYFVQVGVTKGETSYSVNNRFEIKRPDDVVIRVETPKPIIVPSGPKPPPPPVEPPPPEDDPTMIVVKAKIIGVKPWAGGKSTRITFSGGLSKGIRRGAVVQIPGMGSCKVKEVYDGSSVCFVDQPQESYKEGTDVIITSKRASD